jgi:hypothetical protein
MDGRTGLVKWPMAFGGSGGSASFINGNESDRDMQSPPLSPRGLHEAVPKVNWSDDPRAITE